MGRTENPARAERERERVRTPFHEDEDVDDRQNNIQDDETPPNSPTTSRATTSYAPSSHCASPPLQSSSPLRRPPPPPSSSSRAATKRTRHEVGLLRQLGLNEDLTVCGADHVKQLRGRVRNVKKKRKHFHNHLYATLTRWHDVPQEVQARICQRMTLYDTYVARLAGLSSSSSSTTSTSTSTATSSSSSNNQTSKLFLAHKDQNQIDNDHDNEQHPLRRRFVESVKHVQPLRDMWISQRTKARRMVLSPAEFCNLTQLRITKGFEFIPDSQQHHVVLKALHHLPNLRYLSLAHVHGLPSSLGACEERLVDVSLTHAQFPIVPTVLMRMRNVRRLTLDLSPQLQHVPAGLGEALPKLQVLSVVGCPRLKELPTDVLDTIERNARARKRALVEKFRGSAAAAAGRTAGGANGASHKDGDGNVAVAEEEEIDRRVFGKGLVLLSVENFDQAFIQHTFVQSRYPNIVKGMKLTRAGAPPGGNNDNAQQQQEQQEGQGQQNEAQVQLGGNDEDLDDVDLDNLDNMF